MKTLMFAIMFICAAGCTDASFGKFSSLGSSADIKCYSGGNLIYEGTSTGKVKSEESSDGYFFRDSKTDQMMEVSGNCTITYQ